MATLPEGVQKKLAAGVKTAEVELLTCVRQGPSLVEKLSPLSTMKGSFFVTCALVFAADLTAAGKFVMLTANESDSGQTSAALAGYRFARKKKEVGA